MKTTATSEFYDDLDDLDANMSERVLNIIELVENAQTLTAIPNFKKMKGFKTYYRIRMGNYRIGLSLDDQILTFVCIKHRREVYRYFP